MLASLKPVTLTTSQGFDGFVRFSNDGRRFAFSSDRSGTMEIYTQSLAQGATPVQLTSNGRQNVQPVWSPDDQFVAFHEMSGNGIWIVPSSGGAARKVSDFGSAPAWSPDGRTIAFQSWPLVDLNSGGAPDALSTIWMVDVEGRGQPVRLSSPGDARGGHVSPLWWNETTIVFATSAGVLPSDLRSIWRIRTDGSRAERLVEHPVLSLQIARDPTGRGLYFAAKDAHAVWWLPLQEDASRAGEPQPTGLPVTGSAFVHLAVSSDNRHITWTATDYLANVWATGLPGPSKPGDSVVPLTKETTGRFGLPTVSEAGALALIGSRQGSNSSLYVQQPDGSLRQITTDPQGHGAARWMPVGREVALISDHGSGPGLWAVDAATGRERELFQFSKLPRPDGGGPPSLSGAALSTALALDMSRLAISFVRGGTPNVWVASLGRDGPTGALVQRTFEKEAGTFPSWSPDGRWLAYQCNAGSDTHLCVTGAESGDRQQLTNEPGQSWTGEWSPDGGQILIAARRGAVWNVAAVSRATGKAQKLTAFTEPRIYVRYPRWDRTNQRVVFERAETLGRTWMVRLPDTR
jgi:Tol biopolymer transport system component